MKILIINYEYYPIGGGGGVICRDIAEEIAQNGHEVTVLTTHFGSLKKEEFINDVLIIRVPVMFRKKQDVATILSMLSYYPACIKKVNHLMKQTKYDIINTHFAIPSGPAGQYISDKYHIPNVLSIHGGDLFDPSKRLSPHKTYGLKQTVKKMLSKADRVVAQSSDTKNNAMHYYKISRDIDIIPLGIKPNGVSAKTRSELNVPGDKFVFITIGRLIKRKNLIELMEIFKIVNKQFPSQLLIIGEGPEYQLLQKKIEELDLLDQVNLLGRLDDEAKFQYLSAADAYVSTALHEGFGIVFLEAMECSTPVICYNRGGQIDFLENGKTGFLIDFGDKNAFLDSMIRIIENHELRKNICNHNRVYVQNFYIENIAKRYLSIFEEVIRSN